MANALQQRRFRGLRPVRALSLVLMLALSLALTLAARAETPQRVVLLPFTANAPHDISYLVKGVRDILASRLAWQNKVTVVEEDMVAPVMDRLKPPYNAEKAREVGKELSADVVVYGSITQVGQSVSVDAQVVKVKDQAAPLSAFVQAADLDQVIPRMNDFAQRINAEIFRRPGAAPSSQTASGGAPATSGGSAAQAPSGVNALPENISPLNPLFMKSLFGVESDRYWRSPRINDLVRGVGVADVDGDGKNELLALTRDRLRVYRLAGEHFALVNEFKNGPGGEYMALDTADVDQNGRPEVFISCRHGESVESFVLEWQGPGIVVKAKDIPYYFRAQKNPKGEGRIVLGQRTAPDDPFFGPIYRMSWQDGTYKPAEDVNMPDTATIWNFCLADLAGGHDPYRVVVGPNYSLLVYSPSNKQLFMSAEAYNASSEFIPYMAATGKGWDQSRWFLTTRVLPVDLNGDGRDEIIAVRNSDRMDMRLENTRLFFQGTIFSLDWNGMALSDGWRTPKISGYVSDYIIGDVGNVGTPALILAVNQKMLSGLVEKGVSNVVAFTLKPPAERKKSVETPQD
ncbi:MAG: VCBS repeat-containing protein [Deltaproteobacteria bacterium]|nr:VCBS repeat-containing protein [Deltaproteobacteria bacterium]